MPGLGAWLGIAFVVMVAIGGVWLVFWLLSIVLP